jgi:hypothetical protein
MFGCHKVYGSRPITLQELRASMPERPASEITPKYLTVRGQPLLISTITYQVSLLRAGTGGITGGAIAFLVLFAFDRRKNKREDQVPPKPPTLRC